MKIYMVKNGVIHEVDIANDAKIPIFATDDKAEAEQWLKEEKKRQGKDRKG